MDSATKDPKPAATSTSSSTPKIDPPREWEDYDSNFVVGRGWQRLQPSQPAAQAAP